MRHLPLGSHSGPWYGKVAVPRRVPSRTVTDARPGWPVDARWLLWLIGPAVALLVTSQWFPYERLLAGGDNFPTTFINPGDWLSRLRYSWDLTGLGSTNSLIQIAPQILIVWCLRLVLDPAGAQHAYIALIISAQFLGMMALVLNLFPGHRIAAVLAAIFYCFNPFAVLVPPGLIGLFLLAYLPSMGALFLWTVSAPLRLSRLVPFAVGASLSGLLFTNPPTFALFLVFALILSVFTVVRSWPSDRAVAARLTLLIVLFFLANVYWIVQAYVVLFGNGGGAVGAPTTIESYGFVSRRSSILNMFWLNGSWAWTDYFPYAATYKSPLLVMAVYVPALLAFSALLNRAIPRSIVLPAAATALLLLLVSTGQHGPWQDVNLWFFHHVPLFWLFREPDAKFPSIVLVLYAPLIGYQVEWLALRLARPLHGLQTALGSKVVSGGVLIACSAAFLLAGFPLLTGAVVGRGYTGASKVGIVVPAYWYQAGAFIAAHDPDWRDGVLILPNDDYYQMLYDWGFYGADAVATEMIANRTVPVGGELGYTSANSSYGTVTGEIARIAQGHSRRPLVPYLESLGIRYLLQRNDIVANHPTRQVLSPQQVRTFLRAQQGVHFVRSFGELDLYAIDPAYYVPPVYAIPLSQRDVTASHAGAAATRALTVRLGLPVSDTALSAQGPPHSPHLLRVGVAQDNPLRLLVQIGPTRGPVLLVFATSYHPSWHACVLPPGSHPLPWSCALGGYVPERQHVQALGFLNGWIIDHPGRYTVTIDYGFQHIADFAEAISLLTVGGLILAVLLAGSSRAVRALRVGRARGSEHGRRAASSHSRTPVS